MFSSIARIFKQINLNIKRVNLKKKRKIANHDLLYNIIQKSVPKCGKGNYLPQKI